MRCRPSALIGMFKISVATFDLSAFRSDLHFIEAPRPFVLTKTRGSIEPTSTIDR
jgi:hypothetical protein